MVAKEDDFFRRPGALARLRFLITPKRAGARPRQLYKEKVRTWRRRNRLLVIGVSLIPVAFAAGFCLVLRPRNASFLWGFAFGGSAAMFIGTRELGLPDWISNWRVGAEGERRTARRLRRLERSGWIVHHSILTERGDRDHILVGPRGIFLLDSKTRRGRIVVENGGLVVHHSDRDRTCKPEPVADGSKARAGELAQAIRDNVARRTGKLYTPFVQSVVVVWGDFEPMNVESKGVQFVHGNHLANWLALESKSIPITDWLKPAVRDAVAEIAAGGPGPADASTRAFPGRRRRFIAVHIRASTRSPSPDQQRASERGPGTDHHRPPAPAPSRIQRNLRRSDRRKADIR